jgi:hypothetical protein
MSSLPAGRQSPVAPAKGAVADESARVRSPEREARGGDSGDTAGGRRAFSIRRQPARFDMERWIFQLRYEEFFERNSLSEDQKELIRSYYQEPLALRKELRSRGLGEKEIDRHMVKTDGIKLEEVRSSFGDELYQAWWYYKRTIPQRNLATDLSLRFDGIGAEMTWKQKDQLVDILRRNSVLYYYGLLDNLSNITRMKVATSFMEKQEPVMREAARVLNPQQMAVLRQFWSETINSPPATPEKSTMADKASGDAPAGAATSRASHQRLTDHDNQISALGRISKQGTGDEMLQKQYGDFLKKNKLSKKQRKMILSHAQEDIALRKELRGRGMGAEEIQKHMDENAGMRLEKMRRSLGDKLYQAWRYYHATIPQRNLAAELAPRFGGVGGARMTGEQKEQLVDLFYRNYVSYYYDESLRNHSDARRGVAASFMENKGPVMREAPGILAPQQVAALGQFWSEFINSSQ